MKDEAALAASGGEASALPVASSGAATPTANVKTINSERRMDLACAETLEDLGTAPAIAALTQNEQATPQRNSHHK